ncbi:MAG: LysM peptidoglycan-binding domain-containing protein [Gammaproteobacteria bacterium]|nr:MAG: LysM peptidoglycan-binding domain-containing protein [Gammaproteobacteria bacterium]
MNPLPAFRYLLLLPLLWLVTACQSNSPQHVQTPAAEPVATAAVMDPLPDAPESVKNQAPSLFGLFRKPAEDDVVEEVVVETPVVATYPTVWDRMREGFQLRKWYNHPKVKAEMEAMLRNPDYLSRVTERSQRYVYYITNTVETRGLPMELALLPMVESAFDPFAYSPQQAAGLWQFIPGTARHYGIKDSWWYDGRRDVIASTDAALNYLTYLNQIMGGDWLLAVASYNSGEGTVMRARKKVAHADMDDVFWRIGLPKETSAYVPRLLALAAIVDQPDLARQNLHPVLNEPYFAVMENTGGQLDLNLAAELAQVPIEEIYLLNPGFNRWATDPQGPHRLNVPVEAAERFRAGIDNTPPKERIRWERYQVKPGDSLSVIARKFNTTTEQIQASNGLKHSIIAAGQYLLVPTAHNASSSYALSTSARQTALMSRDKPGMNKTLHTVRSGDSYWSIAKQYGTSSEQLARWNNRSTKDVLKIGEKLVVWSQQPVTTAAIPMQAKVGPSSTRKVGYRVRSGDSLYKIATRFSVSIQQILKWNSLDSSKHLHPGQYLTLYVDVTNL